MNVAYPHIVARLLNVNRSLGKKVKEYSCRFIFFLTERWRGNELFQQLNRFLLQRME